MNSAKNGPVLWYSNASPNNVRTPALSASAITSVSNRLFPMPGGPSMTSTLPRPCTSAVTDAPITFNPPARPRIGGVASRGPPTSNRGVEGPTECPVYRLLDCRCSARHCRHPPSNAEYISMLLGVHAIWCSAGLSIRTAHEPRQLFAGVDAQLGERIVDVGFHRMEGKLQLLGHVAVGHALCDQVDDPQLGVGEAVPAGFYPRLAD